MNPERKKRKKEDNNEEIDLKRAKSSQVKSDTKESSSENISVGPQWSNHELLAEQLDLDLAVSSNIIKLFEDGNTIPFIARYRRDVTKNMSPETLRVVKETYEEVCALRNKINTVLKQLEKSNNLTDQLKTAVVTSRSIEELEYVYAPFKPGGKRTLVERAKELGLEEPALTILENCKAVDLYKYVQKDKKELSKISDVEKGIIHIIAFIISTDTELLSYLREMRAKSNFFIKTKKATSKTGNSTKLNASSNKPVDESKFEIYKDFEIPVKYIKPHQILAINRGESLKVLSVKVIVPENIFSNFKIFCQNKFLKRGKSDTLRDKIINEAIEDSYNRLVQPLIIREIRAELKLKAERSSCEVFSRNLKHLLLTPPFKGKPILGIDPGFLNGCKLALISPMGKLLSYDVIYPHKSYNKDREKDVRTLKNILTNYSCDTIALGNGTACRQTEEWLSNLIKKKIFHPLNVQYTIVNEDGASIYSCSSVAKSEFPDLDPNIISAVSLARRLQEPLAELVKIEPRHLGVGMYQHDLKKKQLEDALNDIVSECVSFVGVDLNTASHCLLQHIAGLSRKRAEQIINYRDQKGRFTSRKQLLKVFGIGQKVYQQCAGFLRVGPLTSDDAVNFYKDSQSSKLDCTYIHPESYSVAENLIRKLNLEVTDIGEPHFINRIKSKMSEMQVSTLKEELNTDEHTIELILDTLCKKLNYDMRIELGHDPLFKQNLKSIDDIDVGHVLTGRIKNVIDFGSFIDIGIGVDGLIHKSKYNGFNPEIGEKYEVAVMSVDIAKGRIGVKALKKISSTIN